MYDLIYYDTQLPVDPDMLPVEMAESTARKLNAEFDKNYLPYRWVRVI